MSDYARLVLCGLACVAGWAGVWISLRKVQRYY